MGNICKSYYWINGIKHCPYKDTTGCVDKTSNCGLLIKEEPENLPNVQVTIATWQLCPKCHGQGSIWTPPNIPYNPVYTSNGISYTCDICKGKKIISTITGEPPIDNIKLINDK